VWLHSPATAFGECGEGYLRFQRRQSLENLQQALDRLDVWTQSESLKPYPVFLLCPLWSKGSKDTAVPSPLASDGASFKVTLEVRVKGRIPFLLLFRK